MAVCEHPELCNCRSVRTEAGQQGLHGGKQENKEMGLPGRSWKHVSAEHCSDRSKLQSGNKHFKSCADRLDPTFDQFIVVILQWNCFFVYFWGCWLRLPFIDFDIPIKKLPLAWDRWTGTLQMKPNTCSWCLGGKSWHQSEPTGHWTWHRSASAVQFIMLIPSAQVKRIKIILIIPQLN